MKIPTTLHNFHPEETDPQPFIESTKNWERPRQRNNYKTKKRQSK